MSLRVSCMNGRGRFAVCFGLLLIVVGGFFPLQAWGGTIGAGLELIRRQASIPHGPGLQALARHFGLDLGTPRAAVRALVLMGEGGKAQLEGAGFAIKGHIGDVVSTTVPLDRLESLAGLPDIVYVEGATRYRPALDRSVPDTRADQLRRRELDGSFSGMTGKGVVVGIIDSGLDWRHPDFRRPDGSTRIKFLWDASDRSFEESGGVVGSPPPLGGKGTVYTEGQINAALKGLGRVSMRDECGHGTHVTGVAAGNGAGGKLELPAGTFVGMAPEADIVAIRIFGPTWGFGKLDAASAVTPTAPRIVLSAGQPRVILGQTLTLSVAIQTGLVDEVIDGWVAVQAPDGNVFFAGPGLQTFSSTPAPAVSSVQLEDFAGPILSTIVPDDLPLGTYTFFALGVEPGTDSFDHQHWITNLAMASVELLPR